MRAKLATESSASWRRARAKAGETFARRSRKSVSGMAKLLGVHRVTLHKGMKKNMAKKGPAA
jgi:transcriptional regulator of acetoin/glycerol metabolism